MNVKELFEKIRIDGEQLGDILQVQIDAEHTTVVYERHRENGDPVQRAITVESEAVTFG